MKAERRLAAIMFTDIVGYTALMAESEQKGLAVQARHREVLQPLAARYDGQIVDAMELLVGFDQVLSPEEVAQLPDLLREAGLPSS